MAHMDPRALMSQMRLMYIYFNNDKKGTDLGLTIKNKVKKHLEKK
jgi:hypothetical protein